MNDNKQRYYVLMGFDTEFNIGLSQKPNQWINISNTYFRNGEEALATYIRKCNSLTQEKYLLIDADTSQELYDNIKQVSDNLRNDKWVQENLIAG